MRLLLRVRHFSHTPLLCSSPHWLSSPPLSHLSLLTLTISFSPALFSLPPQVVFSHPPPFVVLCHTCLGVSLPPLSPPPPRRRLPFLFFHLPAASSSFFPHFPLTLFISSPSPPCTRPFSLPGSHLWSTSSSLGFRLIPWWGVGSTSAFFLGGGGVPSTLLSYS